MARTLKISALVLLVVALATQDAHAAECGFTNAALGCPCGGFAPRSCLPSLTCKLPPSTCADCFGKCMCKKLGGEGCPCGGFTTHPKKCLPGFKCKLGKIPDLPGKCTCDPKGAGPGCKCGGFINNAPKCLPGLKCVLKISNPDAGGVCKA